MYEDLSPTELESEDKRIKFERGIVNRLNAHPLWQTVERRRAALNQMFGDSPKKTEIIAHIAFGGNASDAAWNLLNCVSKSIQEDVAGSKTITRVMRFLDAPPGDVESPEEIRIRTLEEQVKSLQSQLDAVHKRLDDLTGDQNSTPLVIPPTS